MDNLHDIVTLIYGVVGFAIGWLWGRHRSMGASFMASVVAGVAGFAVGKGLEWAQILTESWTDKLAQSSKFLGGSASVVVGVFWFAVIVIIPVIAIAAFRKADRQASAELEPPRRPDRYR
jgi:hypothetical protein